MLEYLHLLHKQRLSRRLSNICCMKSGMLDLIYLCTLEINLFFCSTVIALETSPEPASTIKSALDENGGVDELLRGIMRS